MVHVGGRPKYAVLYLRKYEYYTMNPERVIIVVIADTTGNNVIN